NRDKHPAGHALVAAYTCLNRGSRERDEVCYLASVQRQLENSRVFHHLPDGCASRFDLSGIRRDFHLFADLSNFQDRVNHNVVIHLKDDSGLNKCAKTRQRSLYTIGTYDDIWHEVSSGLVRNRASGDARAGLRGRYLYTRQGSAAWIAYRAANLRRCL